MLGELAADSTDQSLRIAGCHDRYDTLGESMARRDDPVTMKAPPKEAEARVTVPNVPAQVGRYELLFDLARGGMGTVHAARLVGAHGVDRLVALKRLDVVGGTTEEDLQAFLREARVTAQLHHPNVVQAIELFQHDGAPVMVMELVRGVSLNRLLKQIAKRGDAVPPDLAGWIVAQAAAGLHAAHELAGPDGEPLGLVHRDVSPQNVLMSVEGRVYVADFGIAKLVESDVATQSGVVKGKFGYMAPEQTRASVLDRRADVFCLGILLHEMLTGRRLFEGTSPADTIQRVGNMPAPDPRDVRPDIPEGWADLALRLLQKDPGDRIPTAGGVADAARQLLRERRAVVDETDSARLVADYAGEEIEALKDRIRQALRGGSDPGELGDTGSTAMSGVASARLARPTAPASDLSGVVPGEGVGTVTAAVTTTSARVVRRRVGAGIAAVGAALALGGLWWFGMHSLERSSAETQGRDAAAGPTSSPASESEPRDAPSTAVAATTEPDASATASSASGAPSASSADAAARVPVRTAPPRSPRNSPPPVVAPPESPPESQAGKPFDSLD